jgi:hypothetical protein
MNKNDAILAALCVSLWACGNSASKGSDAATSQAGGDGGSSQSADSGSNTGANADTGTTGGSADAGNPGATGGNDSGATGGNDTASGCTAIMASTCPQVTHYMWLCSLGGTGMPPDTGCAHPDMNTEPNWDIEYCCPNAVCTYTGGNADYSCSDLTATPHAWNCQNGATPPAGCVKRSSQILTHCCP